MQHKEVQERLPNTEVLPVNLCDLPQICLDLPLTSFL